VLGAEMVGNRALFAALRGCDLINFLEIWIDLFDLFDFFVIKSPN